jgi:hypothetical protein
MAEAVGRPAPLSTELLPGARTLLEIHARELPQRDDLCGAFCGALALGAAGLRENEQGPLDQDAVGVAAHSIVSSAGARDPDTLPPGESGRRDYRLELPSIDDAEISGTTAAGVVEAVVELSAGTLEAIPLSGPWTVQTLNGVFELALAAQRPVTLIANLATHHLWGAAPTAAELLRYLYDGNGEGPAADWDVGHFVCVVARTTGPRGSLFTVADTYPTLGRHGVHLQPEDRLAAAIDRRDKPAGGVIVVAFDADAATLREGIRALGLTESLWDNGTVEAAEAA